MHKVAILGWTVLTDLTVVQFRNGNGCNCLLESVLAGGGASAQEAVLEPPHKKLCSVAHRGVAGVEQETCPYSQ